MSNIPLMHQLRQSPPDGWENLFAQASDFELQMLTNPLETHDARSKAFIEIKRREEAKQLEIISRAEKFQKEITKKSLLWNSVSTLCGVILGASLTYLLRS